MSRKIGVMLSGCGVFDGTEIHEAVLTMFFLSRADAQIICTAPDVDQYHVINHLTQEVVPEKRNVLLESARIARGDIRDVKQVKAKQLDGIILPGGFGAAKNLSDFAIKGPEAQVHPEVRRLLEEMLALKKPIGAICIAPAMLVRALADHHPEVTIGNDVGTAAAIETMGGKHHVRSVDQIHVDSERKIVSTPAYMLGPTMADIALGIEKLVAKVLELA